MNSNFAPPRIDDNLWTTGKVSIISVMASIPQQAHSTVSVGLLIMRSLQVFLKFIVTQLDQSMKLHMITTENSTTYIYSKMIRNTRLFIDQLINSASLKQAINIKKPCKSTIVS